MRLIFITLLFSIAACSKNQMIKKEPSNHFYYNNGDSFINYETKGDGKNIIVFIHGFGGSLETWDEIVTELDQEQKVILVDCIGAGLSSLSSTNNYSVEENAKVIIDLIRAQNSDKVTIVGHSMGGSIAILIALLLQQTNDVKLKNLVLLNPAAYFQKPPFFVDLLKKPIISDLISNLTSPKFRARFTLESIFYDKKKVTEKLINRYAKYFADENSMNALRNTAKQLPLDNAKQYTKQYPSLKISTLIISSKNDITIPPYHHEKLVSVLPNAQLEIIENSGHNVQEEQPTEVAKIIKKFMQRN